MPKSTVKQRIDLTSYYREDVKQFLQAAEARRKFLEVLTRIDEADFPHTVSVPVQEDRSYPVKQSFRPVSLHGLISSILP